MATSSRHLCRILTPLARRVPAKRKRKTPCLFRLEASQPRCFSSLSTWRADRVRTTASNSTSARHNDPPASQAPPLPELADIDTTELLKPVDPVTVNDLEPEEHERYKSMTPREQENYLAVSSHFKALLESPENDEELQRLSRTAARDIERREPINFPTVNLRASEVGYWADDEPDELGQVEDADEDFKEEYITSVAENELELKREIREYARIAAWDMPLLSKYAKPYQPPAANKPLRFRYTTYMGESHPASRKVVVEFHTRDLLKPISSGSNTTTTTSPTLTEPQRVKLLKLAGPRYNPTTDTVKISSDQFEHAAQNKRYLGDLVGKLLAEAQNDTTDTFDDVPLDLRHHHPKTQVKFPNEWRMTPDRVRWLMAEREKARAPKGREKGRQQQLASGEEGSRIGSASASASASAQWMERVTQRVPVRV